MAICDSYIIYEYWLKWTLQSLVKFTFMNDEKRLRILSQVSDWQDILLQYVFVGWMDSSLKNAVLLLISITFT